MAGVGESRLFQRVDDPNGDLNGSDGRRCEEGAASPSSPRTPLIEQSETGSVNGAIREYQRHPAQGKLFSRKRSGNCAAFQRAVKDAIKRARYMALMPYVGE